MICKICNKDHFIKNIGLLTICELDAYLKRGSKSTSQGKTNWPYAFGAGNRFQFKGAR